MASIQMDDTKLIAAVADQPYIWDSVNFHNPEHMKAPFWDSIMKYIISDYPELDVDEQKELVAKAQKRWEELKNSYIAETKRRDARGYRRRKNKESACPHYEDMKFLYPTIDPNRWDPLSVVPPHLRYKTNMYRKRMKLSDVLSCYLNSKLVGQKAFGEVIPKEELFLSDIHTFQVLMPGIEIEPEDPGEQNQTIRNMVKEFLEASDKIKKKQEQEAKTMEGKNKSQGKKTK